MTIRTVSRFEKNPFISIDAINNLASGRTNAAGTVTLSSAQSGSLKTTIVSSTSSSTSAPTAPNCAAGSGVWLFPQTANAASAAASAYVPSTDVTKASFIIHHSSSTSTDRTFFWLAMG